MKVDATRIERVEVQVAFPVVDGSASVVAGNLLNAVVLEKDARDLMHALGSALGYTCVLSAAIEG